MQMCAVSLLHNIKCYVIHQQCKESLSMIRERTFWDAHRKSAAIQLQSVETSLMKRQQVEVIITDRRVITIVSADNCPVTEENWNCS